MPLDAASSGVRNRCLRQIFPEKQLLFGVCVRSSRRERYIQGSKRRNKVKLPRLLVVRTPSEVCRKNPSISGGVFVRFYVCIEPLTKDRCLPVGPLRQKSIPIYVLSLDRTKKTCRIHHDRPAQLSQVTNLRNAAHSFRSRSTVPDGRRLCRGLGALGTFR